jgi:hypothetical protein
MLKKLFLIAVSAGLIFQASEANAAKFRLQGASYSDKGAFTMGGSDFKISGEFSVLTDYLDANGALVSQAGDTLQSWNILIQDSGNNQLNRFVKGYSAAGMGGYTDNSSSSSASTNSFTVDCSASVGGCFNGVDKLIITFDQNFNAIIGDSVSPGGSDNSTGISSTGITWKNTGTGGILRTSTAVTTQADFVPMSPALLSLYPIFAASLSLRSRLKSRHSL